MNDHQKEYEGEDRGFVKEFTSAIKERILDEAKNGDRENIEMMKNWRSWGSWFSWGSPVGLGLFLLSIGGFLVLLHMASIIK
jgi:hypothetical protein